MTGKTSESSFDPFLLLLARLWRARYFLVAAGLGLGIVTYIILRFFTPETFRSQAVVLTTSERPVPSFWDALFLSAETLDTVRSQFRERFPKASGLADQNKFIKRFKVKQDILEDTSVRRRLSPALILEVDSYSPQEAQTLAQLWVNEVVKRYGGASYEEYVYSAKKEKELVDQLIAEEKRLAARQSELEMERVTLSKRVYHSVDVIAPGIVPETARIAQRDTDRNSYMATVQLTQPVKGVEEGLIERRARLEGELAHAKGALSAVEKTLPSSMSGDSGFQNPTWKDLAEKALDLRAQVAGLEAEIKALDETVKRLEESARLDSAALAKVNAEYAEVTSQLENVRRSMMRAQDELAKHLVYARLSEGDILPGAVGPARLDISVMSPPSLPDKRIAPKRTMAAGLATVAGFAIACFLLALFHLAESLPRLERK